MEEKRGRGRPSMNTKSYHVKVEGELSEVLDTISNKNRYINDSIREKMIREKILKRRKSKG